MFERPLLSKEITPENESLFIPYSSEEVSSSVSVVESVSLSSASVSATPPVISFFNDASEVLHLAAVLQQSGNESCPRQNSRWKVSVTGHHT